jgi:2-polyprenyl-6-methoxyphenol hydroxylase-like FAD-dependent oxidoreductase
MSQVLIVGGGLGGVATAAALHHAGIEAHVYERSAALCEIGAGLSVWPNATCVLNELGVLAEARSCSAEIRRLEVRDPSGRLLSVVTAPGSQAQPSLCIHRADLLALLVSLVPPERIHLGKPFEAMDETADGVTARFSDGSAVAGDVLIGADGLFSTVRAALFGPRPPVYRGCHAWRGLADATFDLDATATEFWAQDGGSVSSRSTGSAYSGTQPRMPPRGRSANRAAGSPVSTNSLRVGTSACAAPSTSHPTTRCCATSCTIGRRADDGAEGGSHCSATPRTRRHRFSARARAWRSKTPWCSPGASRVAAPPHRRCVSTSASAWFARRP